jgi:hypothetical protein
MRTKISLIGLSIVLLPVLSFAKQVAVLETNSQKDLLTPQERQYLTDVLRGEAVRVLPAEQDWTVMTRESLNALLPPEKMDEGCEGSCIAEMGKNVAADYVAQARVIQFGSSLAISVELYEMAENKLVSSFNGRGANVEDIEKIIKDQSPDFFKKACGSACDSQGAVEETPKGHQRVIVEIETDPFGAVPMVDGKAIKCTSTPCKALIEVGEHRLSLSKKLFEDKDSLVNIVENNQKFSLKLESNAGSLDIRPVVQKEFEQYPIKVKIDGEQGQVGVNELAPGTHKIVVKHPCYDPIKFNATIEKGKTAIFTDSLKPGVGGLELDVHQGGTPQSVPVYFDGVKVGVTPFSGEVPLCAKIEVGDSSNREAVLAELKWREVVKVVHEMKSSKENAVAPQKETAKPEEKKSPLQKRFWAGAFVAATYNDFYGTKFGFGNLKSGDDYSLRVDGTDDILGNYWGVGANVGISGLYLFNPMLALHADLGIASRRGSGKSDVSVKLFWNDGSRQPEKSDLEMEYYVRQINIDIPLALRVMLPSKVYAEAGPMMSFNLYSKTKFSVTDIYGTQEFREHDCFNTFEFAIVSGVGVMRPIGKSMLDVGLRFVVGVTPLSDADDSPKTWQWQFNVAYWFI